MTEIEIDVDQLDVLIDHLEWYVEATSDLDLMRILSALRDQVE